ncbi:extensin [Chanos chanos]|uniref:Extensin-like n=1 Tax=Chanos chanos TaxID=29144 RepID=A0A6J2WVQ5_CHACN|nr:extensin-like [Chanos chanos]XP_030648344.1 extensin-like [Chanos chanos]
MVRPHSGLSRLKERHFSDGYRNMPYEGRFGPPLRSQRGIRGNPGKAPPSWREANSSGQHLYGKRSPHMGEHRDRPHGQWMTHSQDHYEHYPGSPEPHRTHRRPSPPRSSHPPPAQHRQSPHSPLHGPPGHRQAPFHVPHSSPRLYHGLSSDRRGPSPSSHSPRNPYLGPQRRPSPANSLDRNWDTPSHSSPRERHFGRPDQGGHWNGPGGFPQPRNGESGVPGSPQRKLREFHGRSSYPERWSTDGDPRKQHGEVGRVRVRDGPGRRGPDWAHPHPRPSYPPYSWKSAPYPPPPRFRPPHRALERPIRPPLKRRSESQGWPQSSMGSDAGHVPSKRPRREMSVRPPPRGFGGRGLSLKDKSRILKGRKFRAESVARFKLPPPHPGKPEKAHRPKDGSHPAAEKARLKDHQKTESKRPGPQESPPKTEANSAKPEGSSDTQVESRRSVSAHSSSPIDRRLSQDLVVVSQWQAGPGPSPTPKNGTSWRDRAAKTKTESVKTHGSIMLNERFTKLHRPGGSQRRPREHLYSDRPEDRPYGTGKPLRKQGPFLRHGVRPGPGPNRGPVSEPPPLPPPAARRPLMGMVVSRPLFQQKPVFRKSQSIMSKYRNLQSLRHRPAPPQSTSNRPAPPQSTSNRPARPQSTSNRRW